MYKIIENKRISGNIYQIDVLAPLIANKFIPGEFVIVMSYEDSERIPLTIYDCDKDKGIISIIYQIVGESTLELSKVSDNLYAIVGPLGNRGELIKIKDELKNKKVLLVAGGIGVAAIYPQAEYLYKLGISVDIIYGAKNKDTLIILDNLKNVCDNLIITTDDGTEGLKGFVTDAIKLNHEYDYALTIGPLIMMKNVANLLNDYGITNFASLNPIMVDGTGMCGACRVLVNNEVKFACVDGPEFNAKNIDFDNLIKRNSMYKTEEGRRFLEALEGNTHHGTCRNGGGEYE